jgi:hypothetical protein
MWSNPKHKLRSLMFTGMAIAIAGCVNADRPIAAPDQSNGDDSPRSNGTTPGEPWDLITGTQLTINGALWQFAYEYNTGTGLINPFLSVQDAGDEECFNTDASPLPLNCTRSSFTNKLALNTVPVIKVGGSYYREIILDANEANSLPTGQFSLDLFDLYLCNDADAPTYSTITAFTNNNKCARVYDTREGGNPLWAKATDAATKGSGNALDYRVLIPESNFEGAGGTIAGGANIATACPYNPAAADCGFYLVRHTKMGYQAGDWVTGSTFEEFSTIARPYIAVSKTATPAFTRTYSWEITKSASPTSLTMWTGANGNVDYSVVVTRNAVDGGYSVTGNIVVTNPSSSSVQINKPVDLISGGITPAVTCPGGEGPYTIAAGATLTCTYSATLPDNTTRTNTVNVEIIDGAVSSATAAINFAGVTPTAVGFASTLVTDTKQGDLGMATGSVTYNYTRNYACGSTAGSRTESNTATLVSPNLSDDADVTINCVALAVTKTAVPAFSRNYSWAIAKSVNPTTIDMFRGDSRVATYTVTATRTTQDNLYSVSGNITVSNPSTIALEVTSLTDALDGPIAGTVACVGGNPTAGAPKTIAAGGTLVCPYTATVPNSDSRTNTATAIGRIPSTANTKSFSGTAAVNFAGVTPSVTGYASVTVNDAYNGGAPTTLGTASNEGANTFTYPRTFTCDADAGTKPNTATIVQTGQTANASVTVTCRVLTVTKTAATSFRRSFTWQITKAAGTIAGGPAPTSLLLDGGQTFAYPFAITVSTTGYTDDQHRVNGTISISSPAGAPTRTLNSLADVVTAGPYNGTPSCTGGGFPRTIAGGATISCTYADIDLPDKTARTNTATTVMQNVAIAANGTPSNSGTTNYSGTAAVTFSSTPTTLVDDCVNVGDAAQLSGVAGQLDAESFGLVCVTNGVSKSQTFNDTNNIGPLQTYGACGAYTYTNTANFVTDDTQTQGSSNLSIPITWDCPAGCTLTQGYWKTHNSSFGVRNGGRKGPPIHDWTDNVAFTNWNTWQFYGGVPTAVPSPVVGAPSWYTNFDTPPKGNPYYQASHQFMAALLNRANGAGVPTSVSLALTAANDFFLLAVPTTSWTAEQKTQLLNWSSLFGSYNEGLISGYPHCSEDGTSGS